MSIVDIARIHSLSHGIKAINTNERLQALAECKAMSIRDSRNLQDAYAVITQTRLAAQGRQISNGQDVSNWLNPDDLSKLVRKQLRDSFRIVMDAQTSVRNTYRAGLG
ncbi:MAG: putative nucleotidyltransferase substrate binding domain-containing protein, partial [Pseudomonadota bacterium]|nr:putative nucleotidyltransferase substrate binding domain-containing protein [Pseudomonadota bacterium]